MRGRILTFWIAVFATGGSAFAQSSDMGGLMLPPPQTVASPLAANTTAPVAPTVGAPQPAPQATVPPLVQPAQIPMPVQVAPPMAVQPAAPMQQMAPQGGQMQYGQAQYGQPQASGDPVQQLQSDRDQAFDQALREAFPMSPGQILDYRGVQADVGRAIVAPINPGKPVSRSLRLTLKPGEVTPVMRVQAGVVSTMTFSDATGQPWPVLAVVTGNPNAYVAQAAGAPGQSNIIVVSTTQPWVPSNMVVTLVGYPVPITMAIEQGAPETDYRVDVQVSARGPNASAEAPGAVALAPTDDSSLMAFLDGVPPSAARRLGTTSGDVEAWAYGDMMYVRTPGTILSPAYTARASNVSGVNIFSLSDAPVLLVSRDGRMTQVKIHR